jgi:isopenicillin N synthase-like dioxygenase
MTSRTSRSNDQANIPIAPLPVIDFDKLLSRNDIEIARLIDICKSPGVFYINLALTGTGQLVLDNSRNAFQFAKAYFDQPLEVKLRDTRQSILHG